VKTCVIFNPAARGEKAAAFRRRLALFASQCTLKATTGPGAGRALAAEAVKEGFDCVVAAGGDGTLNEVLNGIGDEPDGFARVVLGHVPLGTVNVFAKELNLPAKVARAFEVLKTGRVVTLDAVAADYTEDGRPVRRWFIQMAGAGLDSRAIELMDWRQKKRIGRFAYLVAALKAMREDKPKVVVQAGDASATGELVLLGNGRYYGGRYVLFPQARLDDGLLEVTVFPTVNWGSVVQVGWDVMIGRPPAWRRRVSLRGPSVRLESASSVPFHLEGENAGHLPVTFTVHPSLLRVVAP
jgi:diacylglycerol kinase (ATP)